MQVKGNSMSFSLTGDKKMVDMLRRFGGIVDVDNLNRVMKKAAKPIVDAARSGVTRRTGLLKKSIGSKEKKYASGVHVSVIGVRKDVVGVTTNERTGKTIKVLPYKYAHLVEFGTRPHKIGSGKHPGAAAKPFLGPAFEEHKGEAVGIIESEIRQQIEKAAQ